MIDMDYLFFQPQVWISCEQVPHHGTSKSTDPLVLEKISTQLVSRLVKKRLASAPARKLRLE
jgi:hypothetical protein